MNRVFGIKKYKIEKNGEGIDIYGGNSLYNNYDAAVEDAFELDADEIVELVFESEYDDIPIDTETVWMNPNKSNVIIEDDKQLNEGNKTYTITYYLNTACRERRPTTQEDIKNDWKIEKLQFNSDLEAYEYVMKECLQIEAEELEDIYSDEDAQNEIEKIEAIQDYFDNQDMSDGSILLVSIEGPEQAYDFGFEKPELEDLEEDLESTVNLKQKFIDYCSDKLEEMGNIEIDEMIYKKIMHSEGIRQFNDVYVIANFEDESERADYFKVIDNTNTLVINTPMIDHNYYASTLQFDKIDKEFYNNILKYWDDYNMEEMMQDNFEDLEEDLEVNYTENISKESAINRAKSCARICYQTRNNFDTYINKMKSDEICNRTLTNEQLKLIWNEYLQSEINEIEKFKV